MAIVPKPSTILKRLGAYVEVALPCIKVIADIALYIVLHIALLSAIGLKAVTQGDSYNAAIKLSTIELQTKEQSNVTQQKQKHKKKAKRKTQEIKILSKSIKEQTSFKKTTSKKDNGVSETVETSSLGILSQQAEDVKQLLLYFRAPKHINDKLAQIFKATSANTVMGPISKGPSGWLDIYSLVIDPRVDHSV
ncbi:hypothetical protein DFH28DRAFT_930909 [Melampsora americana]|nr:hypothetical protein DFH28DRAFT_930909 [Melampsora americana]